LISLYRSAGKQNCDLYNAVERTLLP
jgi:hypothetical protein